MNIKIKVTPNSSRDKILGWMGDELKISLTAPPEKGKANKALIAFLAKKTKTNKSEIKILSGETSPNKLIEIPLTKEQVFEMFNPFM